jgi:hypothetical protein
MHRFSRDELRSYRRVATRLGIIPLHRVTQHQSHHVGDGSSREPVFRPATLIMPPGESHYAFSDDGPKRF